MLLCKQNHVITHKTDAHGFVYIEAHGSVYLFMLIYVNELSLPVKIQAQPSIKSHTTRTGRSCETQYNNWNQFRYGFGNASRDMYCPLILLIW